MIRRNSVIRRRYLAIGVVSLLSLWPLTRVNPIADDLHLVTQGSGLLRQQGLARVVGQWSEFDFSSSHLTPFGGVFTALHVWVANQLALRTPLTLVESWGVLRVLWISLVIVAAAWTGGRLLRMVGLQTTGPWAVALSLIASLQVHAYWSNDPVISFPVASWAFCVVGLLYLGFTVNHLESQANRRTWWGIGAVILSFVGVLTYELFISFIAASVALHAGLLLLRAEKMRNLMFSFFFGAFFPGSILVVTQVIRLAGGSSYSGTEIAAGTDNLGWITVVAFLSSLPLAAMNLTLTVLPSHAVGLSTFLFPVIGLAILAVISLRREIEDSDLLKSERRSIFPLVIALMTLWLTSTLVIVATPKYQSELAGVFGRVYVNYAPGWIAVGLLLTIAIGLVARRFGRVGLQISIVLLVAMGTTQAWANGTHIDVLTRDSSWSTPLLRNLESSPDQNEKRCRDTDFLFSLPLPEYYQVEILDGLQKSYSGTWGLPYCDFGEAGSSIRPLMRGLLGTFPVEHLPDGRRIVWTNSSDVHLQFINPTDVTVSGEMALVLHIPACVSERTIEVSGDGIRLSSANSRFVMNATTPNTRLALPVTLAPTESVTIEFFQSGNGCQVGSDPRELWTMIELSTIKTP